MSKPVVSPRRCCKCRHTGPLTDFYVKGRTIRGVPRYDSFCMACRKAAVRAYVQKNPERVKARKKAWYKAGGKRYMRDFHIRSRYSSTHEAYDIQFATQNGACAICLRPQDNGHAFAFDHDHGTGLTRGVLCSACNGGLGCFRDRPELLRAAITYLMAWASQHAGASNGL